MLRMTWNVLSFVQKVILSIFLTRKRVYYLDRILGLNVKFMCSEYGLVMIYGYDDKIERVILQNGV